MKQRKDSAQGLTMHGLPLVRRQHRAVPIPACNEARLLHPILLSSRQQWLVKSARVLAERREAGDARICERHSRPHARRCPHMSMEPLRSGLMVVTCLVLCVHAVHATAFQWMLPSAWASHGAGDHHGGRRSSHSASSCSGIPTLRASSCGGGQFFDTQRRGAAVGLGPRLAFLGLSSEGSASSHLPSPVTLPTLPAQAKCALARERRHVSSAGTTALQAARRSSGQPSRDDDEDGLRAPLEAELHTRSRLPRDNRVRGVVRDPWEDKQMKRVDFPRSSRYVCVCL
jgi:hypothetical protein